MVALSDEEEEEIFKDPS